MGCFTLNVDWLNGLQNCLLLRAYGLFETLSRREPPSIALELGVLLVESQ